MTEPQALVVMGVSGCGKTSVGSALAEALGWAFYDGDDYHPPANVEKMSHGIPLDDADRQPWLERLHRLIASSLAEGHSLVVACSALKERYRQTLRGDLGPVRYVYLQGDFDLIHARMEDRSGHYMQPEMLRSQFRALEPPEDALTVSVRPPVEKIVENILEKLP
ncbi:MAG: gluconokinase [Anaerolineales bacterium]|jgi:gluconokinase